MAPRKRPLPAPNYEPPRSAAELLKRYGSGERYFAGARLENASLAKADLSGADLSEADLSGADLSQSVLAEAGLGLAKLTGARLDRSNLTYADLQSANLTRANLSFSDLSGADLRFATLVRTQWTGAKLRGADLSHSDLHGSLLFHVNLEGADLYGARNVRLDTAYTKDARFSPKAEDLWSVLRRFHTGANFSFSLLLLAVYFLPYAGRVVLAVGMSRSHAVIVEAASRGASGGAMPDDSDARVLSRIVEPLSRMGPCLTGECREWAIGQVLVGADLGWSYALGSVCVLIYGLCSWFLTRRIAPLRDQEMQSGYSPEELRLILYSRVHNLAVVFLMIAVVVVFWHGYRWLTTPVWLP